VRAHQRIPWSRAKRPSRISLGCPFNTMACTLGRFGTDVVFHSFPQVRCNKQDPSDAGARGTTPRLRRSELMPQLESARRGYSALWPGSGSVETRINARRGRAAVRQCHFSTRLLIPPVHGCLAHPGDHRHPPRFRCSRSSGRERRTANSSTAVGTG